MGNMQRSLSRMGRRFRQFGQTMATRVTAPIVGGAAAAAAAAVQSASEIDRLAKISNASTQEFQRFAAAAKSAGLEQDKVADILKDVNDRVGDFIATGAGPMADFFENIGPKVGVTVDHFKELSGPQALQLYVSSLEKAGVSQQEMTFYLEAMASDVTALLPLLKDNGTELDRLADRAENLGAVMDQETIASLKEAKSAFSALGLAGVGLRNKLVTALAPSIQKIAEQVANLAGWFGSLSPEMQRFIGITGAVAAAVGPLAIALGFVATGLAALASPIGLVILGLGAVAGVAATVAANWSQLVDRYPGLQTALDVVGQSSSRLATILHGGMLAAWDTAIQVFKAVAAVLRGDFSGALDHARGVVEIWSDYINTTFPNLLQNIQDVVNNAVTAGTDIVNSVADGIEGAKVALTEKVLSLWRTISGALAEIPHLILSKAIEIGTSIVDGVVDGIRGAADKLRNAIVGVAENAIDWAKETLGIQSPSREFMEIGRYLMEGFGQGIDGLATLPAQKAADAAKKAMQAAQDVVANAPSALDGVFKQIGDGIARAKVQGQSTRKALNNVFQQIKQDFISSGIQQLLSSVFTGGLGGGGGGLFSGLFKGLFGGFRANGGPVMPNRAYVVGERGPELFMPGNAGTIIPNGGAGGQSTSVVVNNMGPPMTAREEEQPGGGRLVILETAEVMAAAAQTPGSAFSRSLGIRQPGPQR